MSWSPNLESEREVYKGLLKRESEKEIVRRVPVDRAFLYKGYVYMSVRINNRDWLIRGENLGPMIDEENS